MEADTEMLALTILSNIWATGLDNLMALWLWANELFGRKDLALEL